MGQACKHTRTMKGLMRLPWPYGTWLPREKRCLDCGARQTLCGTWQAPLCPVPGCTNRTEVASILGGALLCSEHDAARAAAAEAERVDPGDLELVAWSTSIVGNPACGGCGHPRWAHRGQGYTDGPCVVPGCDGCSRGGYMPSRPKVSV